MAVMVQVDGKNFNNNNPGEFCGEAGMRQHKIKMFTINLYHHSHFSL